MRIRNPFFVLSMVLCVCLTGCERTEIKLEPVAACSASETSDYPFVGEATEVEGRIVTLPKLFPTNVFFIQYDYDRPIAANANRRLPLGPCNLPDKYKVEGLRIVFSARMLWYKHAGNIAIDVSTQPVELTGIERHPTED